MLTDIRSQTAGEIQSQFQIWEEPGYRVTQILEWLYRRRVTGWDAMTNIPMVLRDRLRANYRLQPLELARKQGSRDTTEKFLWRLDDGSLIESVLIPANPALYGDPSDRHTLCVSTQVGCAYGCAFCASGLGGWKRNLRVDEIINQVLAVESLDSAEPAAAPQPTTESGAVCPISNPRRVGNLVIMGMGEPLANFDSLLKALRILNAPWGGNIGARKITISTSGLAPEIRKLAAEPLQFRLAISLHGATDEVRNRIMPINRKYPLTELVAAAAYYLEKKGRVLTLEYILIRGVNDGLDQVKPLADLARGLHAKVNLIPYNHVEGLPWDRPSPEEQAKFLAALEARKVPVTLRLEKGHDIAAACGQLRLKTEIELAQQLAPAGIEPVSALG